MRKRFEKEEMSLYLPSYKLRQLKHLRSTEIILEREKILFITTCFIHLHFYFPFPLVSSKIHFGKLQPVLGDLKEEGLCPLKSKEN